MKARFTYISLVFLFAMPAYAGIYKCTAPGGRVSYQEQPCDGKSAQKMTIAAQPRISADDETAGNAKKLQQDKKKLSAAVRAKLDAGDISGAHAIAVTQDDFNLVREAEDRQRKKDELQFRLEQEHAARRQAACNNMEIDVNRMKQDAATHGNDSWWANRANAEAAKYRAECP